MDAAMTLPNRTRPKRHASATSHDRSMVAVNKRIRHVLNISIKHGGIDSRAAAVAEIKLTSMADLVLEAAQTTSFTVSDVALHSNVL